MKKPFAVTDLRRFTKALVRALHSSDKVDPLTGFHAVDLLEILKSIAEGKVHKILTVMGYNCIEAKVCRDVHKVEEILVDLENAIRLSA